MLLVHLFLFVLAAYAQTTTLTLPNGPTVVEFITTNLGVATTQTLQTLTSAPSSASSSSASSTSSATTATTQDGPGPVGQPAPTTGTPGAPTPYTYTTVVNGVTTAIADIFTPTSPATVNVSLTATGTILDYSSWLSIYGPPKSATNSAPALCHPSLLVPVFALAGPFMLIL